MQVDGWLGALSPPATLAQSMWTERAENRVEGSGAERSGAVTERALQKNDGAERSAEREVVKRKRSGDYENRLACLPLTLRSHALHWQPILLLYFWPRRSIHCSPLTGCTVSLFVH